MAPEVFLHNPHYSFPVDVYSLAMIFYFIFAGARPFHDIFEGVEVAKAAYTQRRPSLFMVKTAIVRGLISEMWAHKPETRPTMHVVEAELEKLAEESAKCKEMKAKRKSVSKTLFNKLLHKDTHADEHDAECEHQEIAKTLETMRMRSESSFTTTTTIMDLVEKVPSSASPAPESCVTLESDVEGERM